MGLFEEYESYLIKYQKIYGDKTIVLYQNGMFFECYGLDNGKEKVGLVKEMSEMLNIQLTRRNKAILENNRSNFLMAGFPLNQLDRYVAMLTEEYGFVVIVVEQITPPPNPKRGVTNIISPGTNVKYLSQPNSNYLLSVYIESEGQKIKQVKPVNLLTIGLSAIDVSTGHSIIYEVCNLLDDENRAFDETHRFIQILQPRELMINSRQLKLSQENVLSRFDTGRSLIHCQLNTVPSDYYKLVYQNEFLGKIFKNIGMLKPIEFINLEGHPTAMISYLLLLNFCYKQSETIIDRIERPIIWNNINHMILDNNCINQLNVISSSTTSTQKCASVVNLVDQTSTAMGKRLLKEKLLLPLINERLIEERYNYLEFFRQEFDSTQAEHLNLKHLNGHQKYYLFQKFESHLKQITDIERLHRKICLGLLQPCEFNQLDTSYQEIMCLIHLTETENHPLITKLITLDFKSQLQAYITYYRNVINLEESSKYNTNNVAGSFFCKGYNSEIDHMLEQLNDNELYFQLLARHMSRIIMPNADKPVVTYDHTEDLGYHLEITAARWQTFNTKYTHPLAFTIKTKTFSIGKNTFEVIKNRNGKNCKITSKEMKTLSDELVDIKSQLLKKVVEIYKIFLCQLYENYQSLMKQLVIFVSYLDMYKSNAKTSLLYNYCRPQFDSAFDKSRSYLHISQLRHPLIERIQENCQYVPQDISFDHTQTGILLFGVNAVGKCYDPETPLLMFDGEIKRCIDIKVGDQLMGDDSKPRNVISMAQGIGPMYDIVSSKGAIIRVNGPHILVLRHAGYKKLTVCFDRIKDELYYKYKVEWINGEHKIKSKSFSYTEKDQLHIRKKAYEFLDSIPDYSDRTLEISVDDYIMKTNLLWKSNYYLYSVGVEFNEQSTDLDPYIVGHWLGNDFSHDPFITTDDEDIVSYYNDYFKRFNLACEFKGDCMSDVTTSEILGSGNCSFFTKCLHKYNLLDNKHIPKEYLINSRRNRLKLLAGLVDSDGACSNRYGFEFVFESEKLSIDLCYLVRSLGYIANMKECQNTGAIGTYWRIYVVGDNFTEIPLLLEDKRPTLDHNKNSMVQPFQIRPVGLGNYCGFLLDNNQRHLLGDFMVGHNSSLMKAVGIATIMAQAGLYVPAKQFFYHPYHCLLTRIVGNDNLFKGLSSFAVEMGELRGILRRANQYSLVLGDEICHGTETISAVSLVASAVITLSQLKTNFLFATHLHQLTQIDRITTLENLKMYHLKVTYDQQTGDLIYDRHLEVGPGQPIYGLEVAKSMDLDRGFIELANEIRKELMNTTDIVPIKKSKYNKTLYLNHCGIPNCPNQAENTHHIQFRSNANTSGFIEHVQKNHKSNLLPLCRTCHTMLHDEQPGHWRYIIRGYHMTSNGSQLDYEKILNPIKKIPLKLKTSV